MWPEVWTEERQGIFKTNLEWLYDNCKDKEPWMGDDAYNKVQEIFDKWKKGELDTEDPTAIAPLSSCENWAITNWGPSFKAEVVNMLWDKNHPKDKLTKEHVKLLYDACDGESCPEKVQIMIDGWPTEDSDITEIVDELNEDVWGRGDVDTVRYKLWSENKTEYPFLRYDHLKYLYSENRRDKNKTLQVIKTIGDFFKEFPLFKEFPHISNIGGGRKASKRKRKKAYKKKRNTKRRRQR